MSHHQKTLNMNKPNAILICYYLMTAFVIAVLRLVSDDIFNIVATAYLIVNTLILATPLYQIYKARPKNYFVIKVGSELHGPFVNYEIVPDGENRGIKGWDVDGNTVFFSSYTYVKQIQPVY